MDVNKKKSKKIPRKWNKTRLIIIVSIIVIVGLILVYIFNPKYSPISRIRDSDGDGVPDASDAFPKNSNETKDSDKDGIGDNGDAFPYDPKETKDTDKDGIGDNSDVFPHDPTETKDSDKDGFGDNADFFDKGDGGIKISIISYKGDGGPDEYGDPGGNTYDVYFIIYLDINNDENYEETKISKTFFDVSSLANPYSIIYNVPENISHQINFIIQVWDQDTWTSDESIDYTPYGDNDVLHTIPPPFVKSFKFTGTDSPFCTLEYKIEAIEMP